MSAARPTRPTAAGSGLTLTDEGQRVLRRVRSRRTAWLATRLRGLSPGELDAVEAAIEPLSRLLREDERP